MAARCVSVSSSQEIPLRYAFTRGGYALACSRPRERAALTKEERAHAASSAALMGLRSLSVSGFEMGIRAMWWEAAGMMRVTRASSITSVRMSYQNLGRRLKMCRWNWRYLLLDGVLLMVLVSAKMWGGGGVFGFR